MSLKTLLSGQSTSVPYSHKGIKKEKGLKDRFFSSVGVPVHTLRPDQNLPLLRMAVASTGAKMAEDDHEFLLETSELFDKEFKHAVRKIVHKDAAKIRFREKPKNLERMRGKENAEGEGATCAASHTDVKAVMIFAKDIEAFERLTERLRPANNSHVAQLKEKAANPDESYFPGNTVKYVVERDIGNFKKVPLVTEIIILMDGCQPYYSETHDKIDIKRGVTKFFSGQSKGTKDQSVLLAAGKLEGKANNSLPKVNRDMARATGMDKVYQDRTYYLVDGVPVTHVKNKLGDNFCFVPNPKTGFYEVDNSYLPKINSSNKSSREEFLILSQDMVPAPDIRKLSGRSLQIVSEGIGLKIA